MIPQDLRFTSFDLINVDGVHKGGHHNHQSSRSYKHKQPISTLKSCSQTIPNIALSMRALKVDADLTLGFIMLSGPTCSYISFKEVVV